MQILKMQANRPENAPAYLANGLVGLRVQAVPLVGGTALVNGFSGVSSDQSTESYADAPYPVGADIQLAGAWLSRRPDLARFRYQEYDLSCGELRSGFDFQVGESVATVEVITFCSRTHPTLTLQEIAVTVNAPCKVTLQAQIDPSGLEGRLLKRTMPRKGCDGVLHWESQGGISSLGAAYVSTFTADGASEQMRNNFGHENDLTLTRYAVDAQPGRRYVLRQIASLVPSVLHDEPHWQASRLAEVGSWYGFDELRQANRDAWAEIWRGRPMILGAEPIWQEVTDASYFYLHSTVSQATPCSVAPFGLSRRKEYCGHVFWDTETFMYPPVLLTAPPAARAMLDYRSRQVQAARNNASLNGFRGIQFPWQVGLTGSEVTPIWAGAGGATEHHINMDVAFAFAQYVHATGDDIFLRQQAWPVLEGVAEWITSRVAKTDRGYEIRHVTGVDEFLDNVHNNSYTNAAAIVVLQEAIACARALGMTPPASWSKVADGMFLPIDPKTQVMMKNDAYEYTGGMCVPETLLAYFPFTYQHSPDVDRATYRYHIDLAETFLGMPMASSLFGVWAVRNGERDLSRRFFEKGVIDFLVEPYHQFNESVVGSYGDPTHALFLTNPAGFLMSLMMGLTGLQLDAGDPREWGKFPIAMPDGWDGIEIERIWARGREARLSAHHGDARAKITFVED